MNMKLFAFVACLVFTVLAFAQSKNAPTEEDKSTAQALKAIFNDDKVALLKREDIITFDFNKKDQKVIVREEINQNFINLDSRADISMYQFYNGMSSIETFDVRLINGKKANFYIKDEAYTSADLFHVDTRVKFGNLNFPEKGYQYNTKVVKNYDDIKYFTTVYFSNAYPTINRSVKVVVPLWLDIELREMNFEGYSISKEVTTDPINQSKTYTYSIDSIAAMYDENNSPGPTYIYPHLLILAKSYTQNGETQPIFSATQDLYNWYKSLVDELVNDNSIFKDKVAELTKNAQTDEEKIKNIYYWVQDNIRYIAFEDGIAGFKPDEASNVYSKKYGDCKGMANLTKQMLIEAGFDARLTWIGTKHIAYDYSTPNLAVDNHMICALLIDDKIIFLDGTEKFNSFGEYADRIQGKQVMIEDANNFILKTVPIHDAEFNRESFVYNLKLSDEVMVGQVQKIYSGESRSQLLYYFNNLKTNKKEEYLNYYLNKGNNNIKVSEVKTSDLLDRDAQINISYDIAIKNAVSAFENTIYINMDVDKELSTFELKKRKTDYVFNFKKDLQSTISLELPAGYTVSHLPKNIAITSKNYDLSVDFSVQNNTVHCKKLFKIRNAKIETSDLEEWNNFIAQLNAVYNDQIILTKE